MSGGIIVTGASGFIGRQLSIALKQEFPSRRIQCLVSTNPSRYEQQGIKVLQEAGLRFTEVDLVSGSGLNECDKRPQLVFHLAANTDAASSDHRCNDLGTQHLLRQLPQLTEDSHFVFFSSVAVMDGRSSPELPLDEDSKICSSPTTEYGRSKLKAEEFLKAESKSRGFRLSIVRPVTVYGKQPKPKSFFDILIKGIKRRSILCRLNWPGLTGFIHVDEVVQVVKRLSRLPPPSGRSETYILCAECLTVQRVCELLSGCLKINYSPLILPNQFWSTASRISGLIGCLGSVLNSAAFCPLWRLSLIVNNTFWFRPYRASLKLPDWKPRSLTDSIADVLS